MVDRSQMFLPLLLSLLHSPSLTWSHGRLIEPPSRSTMWRYGFNNPPNYNDHESYCGGFTRQWQTNGGQCGVCGDPWDEQQPRDNEGGGKFGRGVITRIYQKDQSIKVRIELTANHMGHFEFRLCPQNNPLVPASQACLDRYLLQQTNGEGPEYYPGPGEQVFQVWLQLPLGLTCSQCVLQWRYFAANNWGVCEDGAGKVGCGPQEEFRACSDVSIRDDDGTANSDPNNDIDIVINDIQDNSLDWSENSDDQFLPHPSIVLYEGDNGERVAVIVLASILTAVLLFGGIFLYYYKLRDLLPSSHSFSLPSKFKLKPPKLELPTFKSLPGSLCQLDKFSKPRRAGLGWAQTWLPSFLTRQKPREVEVSPPIPVPPPRTRRGKSRCTSPEPVQAVKIPKSVLDISGPTEVTINGVTVGQSGQSVMGKTLGPTPTSRGVICESKTLGPTPTSRGIIPDNMAPARTIWAAQPALIISDQPDSSLDIPPPLPDCPPPQDSLVISLQSQEDTEA